MIFINYRQEDTKQIVTHLHQRLIERYGKKQVFIDYNDIPIGKKWANHLRQRLEESFVLLAVIGPSWGDVRFAEGDDVGRFRLDDSEDWVRQEICTAIENEKLIVVCLIDNAKLPKRKLKCSLDDLHDLQHIQIRNQADFDNDFTKLCENLESQIPELKRAADLRNINLSNVRSTSKDNSAEQVVRQYLVPEISNYATISLPPISQFGKSWIASINELCIDLPLVITHEHTPIDPQKMPKMSGRNVLELHDRLRGAHTNSLLVDRASRYEDITRDCNIREKLAPGCRMAIIGNPGSGKSTLLQWVAHFYGSVFMKRVLEYNHSTPYSQNLPEHDWLPILILCRELKDHPIPILLDDLLRIHLESRQFAEATIDGFVYYFKNLLEQGNAILLVDGLDEIPNADDRGKFCKMLNSVASRFTRSPIVVTSRVVGFPTAELTLKFDHLMVCPLDKKAKFEFVELWSKLAGWDIDESASFVRLVCHDRAYTMLTENILLLAMIAQIQVLDQSLPGRRVDVYRRAIQLMVERRNRFEGAPLAVNEIIPHLEFLAYWMRKQGLQRCNELEVLEAFKNLRQQESEDVLSRRPPYELLQACIDPLGILDVAGIEIDKRGFDRRVIQFFHQSFQEYFAGQAIKHRPDAAGKPEVVDRLRDLLATLDITDREVNLWGEYNIVEPVIAEYWQETFRMLISDLNPIDADYAFQMLLSDDHITPAEKRPRAIFAMQCLADEPEVSIETVSSVFNAVIDNLQEGDGFNTKLNTWMDEALAAVFKSSFGKHLRDQLIGCYINSVGEERNRIGCCLVTDTGTEDLTVTPENAEEIIGMATQRLASNNQVERINVALELMNRFYVTGGKLGFLTPSQQNLLVESLMSGISRDEASESAIIWALNWLTGSKNRVRGNALNETTKPHPTTEYVLLDREIIAKVVQVLKRPNLDVNTLNLGILILTREKELNPVVHQLDWIYELAVIADGVRPRRALPLPKPINDRAELSEWLKSLLTSNISEGYLARIAETLGSFGVYVPQMVRPLQYILKNHNKKYTDDERDEAMVYLGLIGGLEVIPFLIEIADTAPVGKDDYLYSRGLFGLLFLDNIDVLAQQLRKALPHSDLNSYAYGLAGSRDPRGLVLLKEMRYDVNEKIRKAAITALDKSWV